MHIPFLLDHKRDLVFLMMLMAAVCPPSHAEQKHKLIFQQDLQTFGYQFPEKSKDDILWIDADLAFLSDDLLLVNIRPVGGGNRLSTPLLFDLDKRQMVRTRQLAVGNVPAVLLQGQNSVVEVCGKPSVNLCQTRFLDFDKVIRTNRGIVSVIKTDGKMLYRIPVSKNANFVVSGSGVRFAIRELEYAGLRSLADFGDENGSFNRSSIRVFETASGKKIFDVKWNPEHYRGWDIQPALSRSGHRLAFVRNGQLQIYDLP